MKILNKFKQMIPEKVKHFIYRNIIKIIAVPRIKAVDLDLSKSIIFCKDYTVFAEDKLMKNNYIKLTKYSLSFVEPDKTLSFIEDGKLVNIRFIEGINWIPQDYILYINNNLSNTIKMLYNSFINVKKLSLENSNYSSYNENEFFMNHYMMKILNNRGL